MIKAIVAASMFCVLAGTVAAESLKLAVTTSFHNSGLSDVLLPRIKEDLGLDVHLLIVGTGQALRLGEAGDVDAILVHSKASEEAFVSEGHGVRRTEIMFNDFVIVGPANDPANIAAAQTAKDAFAAIADRKAIFVSRGDDSGTHKKELALWPATETFDSSWYRAVGSGMGASLNAASGMEAYIFADRASWLTFQNKGALRLLFEGDPALFNQYAYIAVHPQRHSHVKAAEAQQLEDWFISEAARDLINGYQLNGETLFTFNATAKANVGN